MKTIGLIGGTSWESTLDYYRLLNQGVRDRLGGFHSARLLLSSVDFAEFVPLLQSGDWATLGDRLAVEAKLLETAGAQAIVLCTNTMHKVAPAVQTAISVPFLDIRSECGAAIARQGLARPLLLGTRYTMESDFFTGHLQRSAQLQPLVPSLDDQRVIDRIIFEELVKGVVLPASRAQYLAIIAKASKADCVIFGCTEIGMLLTQADLVASGLSLPVFDTMKLHVEAALAFALNETSLEEKP